MGLEANWSGYLTTITQMVGIVGGLLLAVITAYVYGREYAEGTAKNMLALPVPRWWLVVAKLVLVALWWLVLVVVILLEAAGVAGANGSRGPSRRSLQGWQDRGWRCWRRVAWSSFSPSLDRDATRSDPSHLLDSESAHAACSHTSGSSSSSATRRTATASSGGASTEARPPRTSRKIRACAPASGPQGEGPARNPGPLSLSSVWLGGLQ